MHAFCYFINLFADLLIFCTDNKLPDVFQTSTMCKHKVDDEIYRYFLPACAVLRAPQSLQPSPHIITCRLQKYMYIIREDTRKKTFF